MQDRKDALGTHLWKIDQSRSKLWADKMYFYARERESKKNVFDTFY